MFTFLGFILLIPWMGRLKDFSNKGWIVLAKQGWWQVGKKFLLKLDNCDPHDDIEEDDSTTNNTNANATTPSIVKNKSDEHE